MLITAFILMLQQQSLAAKVVLQDTHCTFVNTEHCNDVTDIAADMQCCASTVTHCFYSDAAKLLLTATSSPKNNNEFNPQPLLGVKTIHYRPPIV